MEGSIFYYDFKVAGPNAKEKLWQYQNFKIAAKSPLCAIYAKQMIGLCNSPIEQHSFEIKGKNDELLSLAYMSIREVVKFEVTAKTGKTKFRFKQLESYVIKPNLTIEQIKRQANER